MSGEYISDVEHVSDGVYVWRDMDEYGLGHEQYGEDHPRAVSRRVVEVEKPIQPMIDGNPMYKSEDK